MRLHLKPDPLDLAEPPGPRGIDTVMQAVPQILPPRAAAPPLKDDSAFDRWLRQQLGRLHDDVLHEPIPDRLLHIVESADGRH
jgi:hypothetical protein